MSTNKNATLEDLYYEVSLAEPSERVDLVDALARSHPDLARELTDFAAALALDDARLNSSATQPVEGNDPLVMKAMSKLQNRLYEVDNPTPSVGSLSGALQESISSTAAANPFASMSHIEMREFAKKLNANIVLVTKLRDRHIRHETISLGFRARTAELLGVPEDLVAAHFAGRSEIQSGTFFNSSQKPDAVKQETFAEAIANSGLTEEQQTYLLNL